uniref:LACS9 n=1 Tax=Arundo donax TaxID=35708 RepID=A0A0A9F6I8_ARUDO
MEVGLVPGDWRNSCGISLCLERCVQFWEERFASFFQVEHLYLEILRDLSIYALGLQ